MNRANAGMSKKERIVALACEELDPGGAKIGDWLRGRRGAKGGIQARRREFRLRIDPVEPDELNGRGLCLRHLENRRRRRWSWCAGARTEGDVDKPLCLDFLRVYLVRGQIDVVGVDLEPILNDRVEDGEIDRFARHDEAVKGADDNRLRVIVWVEEEKAISEIRSLVLRQVGCVAVIGCSSR
jgi:hypothetical protein